MHFVSLTLQGFRSFRNQSKLVFGEPGLVQVLGVNEQEPELDSNGAGKSTVFEALQWGLFGRTSRNLRAGDVASWEGKKRCEVLLELEDDKHKYLVRRAWNPNELVLTVDGAEKQVDQDTLERTLGYTPDTFLYSVFHAQFIDNFATLTPARQLEIYTAALQLDMWEELSDRATALAKPMREAINETEKEIARLRGTLATALETLETESEKECAWYRERWADVRAISAELDKLVEIERKLVGEKKTLVSVPLDRSAIKQIEKELDDAEERFQLLDQQLTLKQAKLASLRASVDKFNSGVCPTCEQPIEPSTLSDWRTEITIAVAERSQLASRRQAKLEEISKLKWKRRDEEQKRDAANAKNIQRSAELNAELNATAKAISDKTMDRVDWARRKCPHDTSDLQASVTATAEQLASKNRGLDASRARMAALEFWAKAFRDIRLSLIQESIAQFEAVANNAAHALGLDDWAIEFGVESETKSGKLHRGFTVHIRSPYNTERVPFLAWSGGESTRLSLAIGIGFADLVRDFSGLQASLEVWDEPTTWLSGDIESLLTMLHDRAHANNNAIFLIDHRTLESGCFDRTLTVTKDSQGSRIES